MTLPDRGCGEVPCDDAAAVAVDVIVRGVAVDVCWAEAEVCVVCLLGCWVDALALESEAGVCWRKAAKKVERKKGRWDDMLPFVAVCGP